MSGWTDPDTLAYCGWICAGCEGLKDGCAGCRQGGGEEACLVRACVAERGIVGCWECDVFPCDRGPFGKEEWRGVTVGLVCAARRLSVPAMLERVRSRLGDQVDYGALSGKAEGDIEALLGDE